mgnify:CR=1 FL=1
MNLKIEIVPLLVVFILALSLALISTYINCGANYE